MTPMTVDALVRFLETAPEEHCVVYLRKHPCFFCDLLEPVLQRVVDRLGVPAYVADATHWTDEEQARVQKACFGTRLSFPTMIAYNPDAGYGRWLLSYAPGSVLEPFIMDWSW